MKTLFACLVFMISGCADYVYQNPAKEILAMWNEPNAQKQAEMEKKIDKASLAEARRLGPAWVLCRVMADERGLYSASVLVSGSMCIATDKSASASFHTPAQVETWRIKIPSSVK